MMRKNSFDGLSRLARVKRVAGARTAVRDGVNGVAVIAKSKYYLHNIESCSQVPSESKRRRRDKEPLQTRHRRPTICPDLCNKTSLTTAQTREMEEPKEYEELRHVIIGKKNNATRRRESVRKRPTKEEIALIADGSTVGYHNK
jgi:hypothetical protein